MIDYLSPDFQNIPGRTAYFSGNKFANVDHIDVSFITPYFNTEPLFQETLNSILAQTLQNWELIIVDDGSTDSESVARLDKHAQCDSRIRVIRQENAGPSAARNTAARNASGRYLCILDSDDLIEPTYLEKCVWFLDSNPEFAFCNAQSIVFGEQQYLWTLGFERNELFLRANSGPPISVIRREAYEDIGGFDESIRFGHEDWDFWLSMASAGHWGYTLTEFLQWYRKRSNGRFEEIMRSETANSDFEKLISEKYKKLHGTFPNPQRRYPQPFETLPSTPLVQNPLLPNPNGRRILFIIPWMVTGGADRVNLDLIEGLSLQGHQVTICATLTADHRWKSQFAKLTPDIFILPNFLHLSDYPRFLSYLINSRVIDTVVISGSTIGYQLLPYLRASAPQTAFVDLSHVEEPHWLNGGHPRFGVGYQGALDVNITTTKHLASWMEEKGADRKKIRVLYTGIKSARIDRTSEHSTRIKHKLGIVDDVPIIVFGGRICEQKRPAILAEILKTAHAEGIKFQALIVGHGELYGELEKLISEFKLTSCVKLLGMQPHDNWLEILSISNILLLPSQYEGISIALLEAMTAGVVPIISDAGGQNEIVDETSGFLISFGESEVRGYVDAINLLVRDPLRCNNMASKCREIMAEKLSWIKSIHEFESIISHAQEVRKNQPKFNLDLSLATELATIALEYKRLSDAVDWLWSAREKSQTAGNPAESPILRLAVLLSSTKLGRYIETNSTLKSIGKCVLRKLKIIR